MEIRENGYVIDYEPETGDAFVSVNGKRIMHMSMDAFLDENTVRESFLAVLEGIKAAG